jgi:kinesin family protein 6/9
MKLDPEVLLKKYEKEIRDLRQELAMHDTLANRGRINYEPYTPEQQYDMQKKAKSFLDGEQEDLDIESLRQVKELFFQFRNIYRNLVKDIKNNNFVEIEKQISDKKLGGQVASQPKNFAAGVGQEEAKFGFGVGKAPKDAKPTTNIENLVNIPKDIPAPEEKPKEVSPEKREDGLDSTKKLGKIDVDKNQLFGEFKNKEGLEINESIKKNMNDLADNKQEIKIFSSELVDVRKEIERVTADLQRKQEGKNQEVINLAFLAKEHDRKCKKALSTRRNSR